MKKNYINPLTKVIKHNLTNIIATSASASEEHYGGNDPTEKLDPEETPNIGGTGDNTGFTQGSKRRGYFYN